MTDINKITEKDRITSIDCNIYGERWNEQKECVWITIEDAEWAYNSMDIDFIFKNKQDVVKFANNLLELAEKLPE